MIHDSHRITETPMHGQRCEFCRLSATSQGMMKPCPSNPAYMRDNVRYRRSDLIDFDMSKLDMSKLPREHVEKGDFALRQTLALESIAQSLDILARRR